MRLYIAGPMTGLPEGNFPAFMSAARELKDAGYEVYNPATAGLPVDMDVRQCLKVVLNGLLDCDGICLLPNWHQSTGARIERGMAAELKYPAADLDAWLGVAKSRKAQNKPL